MKLHSDPAFRARLEQNVKPHRVAGYAAVDVMAKPVGGIPGDMSDPAGRPISGFVQVKVRPF